MKRRLIAVLLAVTLAAGGSMSVWAAEETEEAVGNELEGAAEEAVSAPESYEEPEIAPELEEAVTEEALITEAWEAKHVEEPVELAENADEAEIVETAETVTAIDENGLKWELADGVLTISGNGVLEPFDDFFYDFHNNYTKKEEIISIIIEEGITGIGDSTFGDCRNLTSIELPKSLTKIGEYAFVDCRNLTGIKLPESVTEIGGAAFCGCRSLTSIELPESITEIRGMTFWGCSNLTDMKLPESVTEIRRYAFFACGNLTGIELPESVTKIGNYAFGNCSKLTDIKLPESVTEIGGGAFYGCTNLTGMKLPGHVTKIGAQTFSGCSTLTNIKLPGSVAEIEYLAFQNCGNLKKITIPESVKSIGTAAFSECTGLQSVTFNGNAPEIDTPVLDYYIPGSTYAPFNGVTATAYYPAGNQTYTDEVKAAYGEGLTWEETVAAEIPFSDVKEADWYYDAADFVFSRGIMTGMNDTEFGPSVKLSRAQFATILYRMEGEPETAYDETAFSDVADGMFYTQPVMWAKGKGVIKGYEDGRFGPADENTREQMAVLMYRYAQMKGLDLSASDDLSGFPDADKVSGFAEKEMKWAVGKGLIQGDGGKINPQGTAERAQCATVIMRFMEAYGL